MAISFERFEGQVPNSQGDLVAVTTAKTLIFSLNFHNTDSVARTLSVWLHNGTTSRKILEQSSVAADATVIIDTKYTLDIGDKVEGECDAASVMDFWISAAEIT